MTRPLVMPTMTPHPVPQKRQTDLCQLSTVCRLVTSSSSPPQAVAPPPSANDVDGWRAAPIVGSVPAGLWKKDASDGELTPALTGVRLDMVPGSPDVTRAIEQRALLFDPIASVPLAWQAPAVPAAGGFTWDHDGPFETIKSAAAARASLLGAMVSAGYLDQPSLDAIDVDLIVATQPCFMADPMLCRLGADQMS